MITDRQLVQYFAEAATAAVWLGIAGRRFFSTKPLPRVLAVPGKIFKFGLILATLGLLVGCGTGDPLAQASGPVFALNVGHWQPAPRDLARPPSIVEQ